MSEKKLIEQCVICGIMIRDDRTNTRLAKPHYHWMPSRGETVLMWNSTDEVRLHATVCAEHINGDKVDWSKWTQARVHLLANFPQYMAELKEVAKPSLNASLDGYLLGEKPEYQDKFRVYLDGQYSLYQASQIQQPFFKYLRRETE